MSWSIKATVSECDYPGASLSGFARHRGISKRSRILHYASRAASYHVAEFLMRPHRCTFVKYWATEYLCEASAPHLVSRGPGGRSGNACSGHHRRARKCSSLLEYANCETRLYSTRSYAANLSMKVLERPVSAFKVSRMCSSAERLAWGSIDIVRSAGTDTSKLRM